MIARAVAVVVTAAALTVGALALRAATLSTHQPQDPRSTVELVVHARARSAEASHTVGEMVEALVLSCRLEVAASPAGPLEALGDGRFRMRLRPALDDTDRRQFRGCLEDWRIDHVQAEVERLRSS